jgi:hypothetical protein
MHTVSEEKAAELRKKLLERQLRILRRYYPEDDEQVKLTIAALEDQLEKVEKNGKFSWEF